MKAIICKNVSKSFLETKALQEVNLELEENGIYGLIGRNGAGKTTLMNCLCTKYLPDSGEVFLFEESAYENEKVLSNICFMSDKMLEFELYTVKKILKFASSFYEKWDEELEEKLLTMYEIDKKSMYEALSKGKQTIISIIIGLCSGCDIVLFDEIYSGMDAVARQQFYEILIEEYEKKPRTFVISTHLIEEMTGLFTDIIIMDKGKVILSASAEEVYEKSFVCTGRMENAKVLESVNVIGKKEMGSMAEYYIYDTLAAEKKKEIENAAFTLVNAHLQDMFVAYTSSK